MITEMMIGFCRFGRKLSMIVAGPVQILGWLLVYVAQNYYYLLVARFLTGFSGAVPYTTMMIFVSEISEHK
jgi:predicted MFS family arabinose efflux permease